MDPIESLRQLVSINSVFPNERELGAHLENELSLLGFSTQRIPISGTRFNIVGERGSRGKPILLYGHMDTVPPYGKWRGNPFSLREEGDRLFGLGAFDMKAGIAAILAACSQRTDRRIKVAFGVDEENVSEGAHALLSSGLLSDAALVFATEIATGTGPCRGESEITLGRRGRCVIELFVPGKSSHGAQAHRGVNAISEASRLALELEKMDGSLGSHPQLPPPTQFIRKIHGESTSLSVPDGAVLELDRHMVEPETPQSVLAQVNGFISGLYANKTFSKIEGRMIVARLKERRTPYLAPYLTPQSDQQVQLLSKIVSEKCGECHYAYGASVADENALASLGVPVVSVGPMGGGEHTSGEWVSKASCIRLAEILEEFIRRC